MNRGSKMTDSHKTIITDESTSTQVIEVVTELEDAEHTELPPLFEAIDPEALDAIVQENDATVSFQYAGYSIEVRGTAEIIAGPTE